MNEFDCKEMLVNLLRNYIENIQRMAWKLKGKEEMMYYY